jgi:two-component system cell cycle sensor histidine kinase/response regulator CckA
LVQGEERPARQYTEVRRDGSEFVAEVMSTPLRGPQQEVLGYIGITRDITALVEAQEKLRESNELLSQFVRNSPIHAYIKAVTPTESRVLQASDSFQQMVGLSGAEMLGKTMGELLPPELAAKMTADDWSVAATGQVLRRDEELNGRSYETIKFPVVLGDRTFLAGYTTDITERKRAEAEILETSMRLQFALRAGHLGVWDWNLKKNIMVWDDEMLALYGLTREQFPGGIEAWKQGLHPEDRERAIADCQAALDGSRDFDTEFRVLHPNGIVRHVKADGLVLRDESGTPIRMLGVNQDITGRKQAEAALRESEERFRASFMTGLDAICWATLQDGKILEVNPEFDTVFGYPRDEAIGKTSLELGLYCDPSDRAIIVAELQAKGFVRDLELKARKKGGQTITISPFCQQGGQLQSAVSLGCHQGYHRAQAGRGGEGKTRSPTPAGAEDGIRGPSWRAACARLQQHAGGDSRARRNGHGKGGARPTGSLHSNLEEIRKAAERSANLTRQLLAFARKQTVAPKVLDLNETVESMLKMLRRLIGEDVNLVWLPGAGLCPVKVDPSQIDQILANLCVNARDAIGGVGKLTIETANCTFDDDYCATHAEVVPGEYVRLAVTDDGCGMDKATQDRLFEPFFTTKEVGKGTGLGLATVYGIVKQNNCFINVTSEPGKGARFEICLPRHVAAKTGPAQSEPLTGPAAGGHETILVVEDELAILDMTKTMLERLGYIVLAASTPGEAIRLAGAYTGVIHLLMTDVVMPEMNGRDLARDLLTSFPALKRLFMSGRMLLSLPSTGRTAC